MRENLSKIIESCIERLEKTYDSMFYKINETIGPRKAYYIGLGLDIAGAGAVLGGIIINNPGVITSGAVAYAGGSTCLAASRKKYSTK